MSTKSLNVQNMNQHVHEMVYAVRGEVPIAAGVLQEKLTKEGHGYPFDEILYCNIGNPQSVGQKPITFYRQCLALLDCPSLLDTPGVEKLFPSDVIQRAKNLLPTIGGGTGAYSHSQGLNSVREEVAAFVAARDGHPCDHEKLFLTNGASSGIGYVMQTMLSSPKDAVLIPKPQYPIYTALLAQLGAQPVFYELDEEAGWTVTSQELNRTAAEAKGQGLNLRAMVVINPGNPTGQCMGPDSLKQVAHFCKDENLVLIADEVYQENVYADGKAFVSLKKVIRDEGPSFDDFELASFHSTSKGLIGECGRRGGYMELCGFDEEVFADIYKLVSSTLCSNLDGQLMTALMVTPPKPEDESYPLFMEETQGIYQGLKRKSAKLVKGLNQIDGVSCQAAEGAMYVFPKIEIPQAAIEEAEKAGKTPDNMYCLSLLDRTGICCVPGSGFGQKDNTFHLRATFLPPEDKMDGMIAAFGQHHAEFSARYAGSKL